jgi:hypothetical protein
MYILGHPIPDQFQIKSRTWPSNVDIQSSDKRRVLAVITAIFYPFGLKSVRMIT